ncbi:MULTISPECIES: ATP-binding protein [Acidiphilium]|uniref:Anti-sigma regulatory factor (Ser/Thr protein kinase) n=1 Tax=Acidiphilium rubrum TaxID=526 RepID=A0A8G2CHB9_ACIRU|nr:MULTISPECIES: ATP-binding protein [Acidiphilium]SIQ04114.1 Anti-sigma regulatory factor (Ser/Thr protein kinase) [Acidiphilium rubrum]
MAHPLAITTAPADLARLYPWLDEAAAAAGVTEPLLGRMHVAAEEAVMNVAMHGIGLDRGDVITVSLRREDAAVALVVEDSGPAFDPVAASAVAQAVRLEAPGAGGAGLRLLRHYCKEMAYHREAGINRLVLRFAL